MPTMAFDSARNRFVTFESNTWQLEYTWLGTITTIGQSCKGSNGKLPSLWPLRTPQFNTNFELCLSEGPPRQGWILFLHPAQSFLDLGPHGAPGCAGYLTPGFLIAHVGFLSAAGHANPAPLFTVSNDLNLLGGSFHAQAFIHDPNANPAGWITTNGLKILVGY